jgi:hypothetical protein
MASRFHALCAGVAIFLVPFGLTAFAAEEAVFEMQAVSVFDEAQDNMQFGLQLLEGQYALCDREPRDEVKAYPELKSSRALYGSVVFGEDYFDAGGGIEFHFVLDESGDEKRSPPPSLLKALWGSLVGGVLGDASPGKHDRLYFDANRDLDLTNDPVLTLMKDPPAGAFSSGDEDQDDYERIFDYLDIEFGHGAEQETGPLRLLPKLWSYDPEYAHLAFVPTVVRKGNIRIGSQEYSAILAQSWDLFLQGAVPAYGGKDEVALPDGGSPDKAFTGGQLSPAVSRSPFRPAGRDILAVP